MKAYLSILALVALLVGCAVGQRRPAAHNNNYNYNSYSSSGSSSSYGSSGYQGSGSQSSGTPQTTGGGSTTGSPVPGGTAQTWLNEHNRRRNAAGIPSLGWSTKLAQSAQNWANNMADNNNMVHSRTQNVGENIAMGQTSISQVMTDWADNEQRNYNPSTHQCNGMCGHFTQVMWKTTTLVGCAMAEASDSTPYYCCQYIRPGNCNGYNYMSDNSPCPLFSDATFNP